MAATNKSKAATKQPAAKLPAASDVDKVHPVAIDVPVDIQGQDSEGDGLESDDDLPEVTVSSTAEVIEEPSPWMTVDHMSDDDMEVEAFNVAAAGRAAMLLRFRVNGQLTGFVHQIEKIYYNPKGKPGKEFVPR